MLVFLMMTFVGIDVLVSADIAATIIIDRPFDDLVQLAAVKPHPPALGTVVNFYAEFVGHNKSYIAMRTIHNYLLLFNDDTTNRPAGNAGPVASV
jgi:hypothetical protein